MIFRTPYIKPDLQEELEELDSLRERLGTEVRTRSRWLGALRRQVRASSIGSSTSIEGFTVSSTEALALTSGRKIADQDDEDRQAVACYARAMDHVGTMAVDPGFRWLDRVILDLHFEACYFQRDKDPGLWRTGPIGVTGTDGSLEYRGPFRDGNGRISRIVQSLVLARGGLGSPEFFSIEDHLGSHTQEYYAALRETQGGSYQPQRDATGWVAFCLDAHLAQARQRLRQIEQAAARWELLEDLATRRGWPDRMVIGL